MRLLHPSDWHLGRTLHGLTLIEEQRRALDRIVGIVSHVEELKARIPDRVEVRRSAQNGPSTLVLSA